MFSKFFGGNKKSDYYRELDEKEENKSSEKQPEAPAETTAEKPSETASATSVDGKKEDKKEEKKAEPVKAQETKNAQKSDEKEAPKPTYVDATQIIVEAVSRTSSSSDSNGKVESQEVEFASKHLVVQGTPMSRRRPGPSLEGFKAMARQAKIPQTKG